MSGIGHRDAKPENLPDPRPWAAVLLYLALRLGVLGAGVVVGGQVQRLVGGGRPGAGLALLALFFFGLGCLQLLLGRGRR